MSVAPVTPSANQCQTVATTPTSSNHAFRCLKRQRFEVIHTSLCTRMNHGEFPADLVARNWMICRELCRIGDDIKVWQ